MQALYIIGFQKYFVFFLAQHGCEVLEIQSNRKMQSDRMDFQDLDPKSA